MKKLGGPAQKHSPLRRLSGCGCADNLNNEVDLKWRGVKGITAGLTTLGLSRKAGISTEYSTAWRCSAQPLRVRAWFRQQLRRRPLRTRIALADLTINANGTLALIEEFQGLSTFEWHGSKLDIYAYGGTEYVSRTATETDPMTGKHTGYGNPLLGGAL
jgi:hypothetical protein